jgi:hypothetical protein
MISCQHCITSLLENNAFQCILSSFEIALIFVTVKFFYQLFLTNSSFYCQLLGTPKIHKKDVSCAHGRSQWLWEVDFTPSCGIGQSSALCLELHMRVSFQNFCSMKKMKAHLLCRMGVISLAILNKA